MPEALNPAEFEDLSDRMKIRAEDANYCAEMLSKHAANVALYGVPACEVLSVEAFELARMVTLEALQSAQWLVEGLEQLAQNFERLRDATPSVIRAYDERTERRKKELSTT